MILPVEFTNHDPFDIIANVMGRSQKPYFREDEKTGQITVVKRPIDIWPADKPVPEGMVRTKKGTLIAKATADRLQQARDNAKGKTGRPKARHTLLAEKMKEKLIEQAHGAVSEMVAAQIANAKGLTVMMARKWETTGHGKDKKLARTGEFAQVKDPVEIEKLLNGSGQGNEYYQIVTKNPSVEAFKVLLEHSVGKPKAPDGDGETTTPLAVIINNIQKESGHQATVTVVPRQVSRKEE